MTTNRFIYFNESFDDFADLIENVNEDLLKNKIVEHSFKDSIINREKEFPTGLILNNNINIAIPHTESKHVKKTGLVYISLKKPIVMRYMVDPNKEIDVKTIFLLLIGKDNEHMEMLSKLIEVTTDTDFINLLLNSKSEQHVLNVIEDKLGKGVLL